MIGCVMTRSLRLRTLSRRADDIENHFGINSPRYLQDIDTLKALYKQAKDDPSLAVKRRLWQDLLRTALGEIAQNDAAMDDLFIRHTYLTTVIGIVVQASFGIDIRGLAETRPDDLVLGQKFRSDTGLEGVIESDFFAWPTEVGADGFLKTLARRIARFDWLAAPTDVAAILYERLSRHRSASNWASTTRRTGCAGDGARDSDRPAESARA